MCAFLMCSHKGLAVDYTIMWIKEGYSILLEVTVKEGYSIILEVTVVRNELKYTMTSDIVRLPIDSQRMLYIINRLVFDRNELEDLRVWIKHEDVTFGHIFDIGRRVFMVNEIVRIILDIVVPMRGKDLVYKFIRPAGYGVVAENVKSLMTGFDLS